MTDLAKIGSGLEPEKKDLEWILTWLRDTFQIDSDSDLAWAAERLKDAKVRFNELEAQRTAITGPLLTAKVGVDGLFKPLTTALSQAEQILKMKIAAFTQRREDERRQVMAASAAEHAAGGIPTAIIPAPAQATGISVRKVWDFEVLDAAVVPRHLCIPDPKLIEALIPKEGEPPQVPGVRFFQRDQVAARVKP